MKNFIYLLKRVKLLATIALVAGLQTICYGQQASANLDQARNGPENDPWSPANWVNGNAGAQNSHYIEGHSIPNRLILSDMPIGETVIIELAYNTKHSGRHGIDYLTYFDRNGHFHCFIHGSENEIIDPLLGLGLGFPPVSTFPLPVPSGAGGEVAGQPAASFNSLPADERVMTIWNGTISSIVYTLQQDMGDDITETHIEITLVASAETVVMSWGGHIASRNDWLYFADGTPRSAAGIQGSPYHMNLVDWNLGNLGNTDRSLQTSAVRPPPSCAISGNSLVCSNTITTFHSETDAEYATFLWSISGDGTIVGSNTGETVDVLAGASGSYEISVEVTWCGLVSNCALNVDINLNSCSISGDNEICSGESTLLTATGGMASYLWSNGATTQSITVSSGGTYSVTTLNQNGCVAICSIDVIASPAINVSIIPNDALCFGGGNSGSANASVSGGTAPFSYSWSNGAISEDISGLAPEHYSLVVTDALGCQGNGSVDIDEPPLLEASAQAGSILCFGGSTSISVSASGGTPPYSGTGNFSHAAGAYSYTVTDANGCQDVVSGNISQPSQLDASAQAGSILCFGGTTTVSVSASGGTPPYSGTGDFVRSAGAYSYTVTDANGCQDVVSGNISQPSQLDASAQAGSILCFGGSTTVSVSASGGTPPYSGTGDFVRSAGAYSFTVTDANGCQDVVSGNISQPSQLDASAQAGSILCFGGSTTVSVSASGGTPPYSGTGNFSHAAGAYSYTVTDANGCQDVVSGNISQPSQLDASAQAGSILCFGGTTTVSVSASGGTAPYSGTGDFVVSAGAYSFTVTDANGCQDIVSGNVNQPSLLEASASQGSIGCFGGSATITVSASGGTPPYSGTGVFVVSAGAYSYTVTDANGCQDVVSGNVGQPSLLEASAQAGSISCFGGTTTVSVSASGGTPPYSGTGDFVVSAGNYSYTVTDANGCQDIVSGNVSQPSQLDASAQAGSILCFGGTAIVSVSASGGTPPYSGTGNFVRSAGSYSFTVTDANGCQDVVSGNISQPSQLDASAQAGSILCFGGTTTVSVSASGGTPPYSGTGDFVVSAGNYSYTVTDANGCQDIVSGNVSQPTLLEASAQAGSILCFGGTTTVSVSASGGTPPYSGTGDFVVSAGDYSYTVTDANGCQDIVSGSVSQPSQLVAASSSAGAISCFGGTTIVSVSGSGGTPPYSGTGDFEVGAGDYSYTVTDANGCQANTSISISQPPILEAASEGFIPCYGDSVIITVSASGGTEPYSGTGEFLRPAGDYFFVVFDANECFDTTFITLTQPPQLTLEIISEVINFQGSASVTVNGGTPPYSYLWFPGGQTTAAISGLASGSYFVYVSDANGCLDSAGVTFRIIIPPCYGAGGGHTPGYWSNKNGQARINAEDIAALNALHLRDATGSNFDMSGSLHQSRLQFRVWLLNGTAVNMAYMLSVHLSAMTLNVREGFVNGAALINAPGTSSANGDTLATINDILAEAEALLALDGYIPSGDPLRPYAEALKNALDRANNNLNFLIPCVDSKTDEASEFDLVETGILEVNELNVYPNPTSGIVYIDYPVTDLTSKTWLYISDITGHQVYARELDNTINSVAINLQEGNDMERYTTGFYFVSVTNGNNVYNQKLSFINITE